MEDVLVLTEMMFEKYPNDRLKAFEEYSKHRNPDAEAMCDLAMYNYIEVRKNSLLLVADLALGIYENTLVFLKVS